MDLMVNCKIKHRYRNSCFRLQQHWTCLPLNELHITIFILIQIPEIENNAVLQKIEMYMLRVVCMHALHICIPVCMQSHDLQEQKSHGHVIPRPEFPVLSNGNGALVFAVSVILFLGKRVLNTIHGKSACINLHLQHTELNLQENQVHHSKERKMLVQKQHQDFTFALYLIFGT